MLTTVIALGILGWAACGVLTYGIAFARYQREYKLIAAKNYVADRNIAIVSGLLGPIGLFSVVGSAFIMGGGLHGLKFK